MKKGSNIVSRVLAARHEALILQKADLTAQMQNIDVEIRQIRQVLRIETLEPRKVKRTYRKRKAKRTGKLTTKIKAVHRRKIKAQPAWSPARRAKFLARKAKRNQPVASGTDRPTLADEVETTSDR